MECINLYFIKMNLRTFFNIIWLIVCSQYVIARTDSSLALGLKSGWFTVNKGQIRGTGNFDIFFKTEFQNSDIYITSKGITYLIFKSNTLNDTTVYEYERFDIELTDASIDSKRCILNKISNATCNFILPHCAEGIYNVHQFQEVIFNDIYPGIDWKLQVTGNGLKHDFIVHPKANPDQIKLLYRSLKPLTANNLSLNLDFSFFDFTEGSPICYLLNSRDSIQGSYQIMEQNKRKGNEFYFYETVVKFKLGTYSKESTLVIDPLQLVWGTYFGGNKESYGSAIKTDSKDNVYVLGTTNCIDLPTQQSNTFSYFQGSNGGNNDDVRNRDMFLLKFNNSGQLLWSTYFGGSNTDTSKDLGIDSYGNLFILGSTTSYDFPLKNPGGNAYFDNNNGLLNWYEDYLLAKFSPNGLYLWGTYYGGDAVDKPCSLSIDANNDIYIVGTTLSNNFPLFDPGGGAYFQTSIASFEGTILKFSNSGQRLYSSYFGGPLSDEIWAVTSDPFGNTYLGIRTSSNHLPTFNPGSGAFHKDSMSAFSLVDGYILKLNSSCQPVWGTYLGGTGYCTSLACDKDGDLFMLGSFSSGFPTVNPGGGAFYLANSLYSTMLLARFNQSSQMEWCTYFGTAGTLGIGKLHIGICNELYVNVIAAKVYCSSCPHIQTLDPANGAYFDSLNTNSYDQFIAAFSNSGVHRWGTFFGGDGQDNSMILTTDRSGNIFYTGEQGSEGYNNNVAFASYTACCIVDPKNGAYYQALPINTITPRTEQYCVIGKFNSPKPQSTFITEGCGAANNATIIPAYWGPYSYTWSTGSNNSFINNVNAGAYTYTLNDDYFGCNETKTVFLGLPSLTITTVSNQTVLCLGDSIIVSANGANSYSWSPNIAISKAFGSSIVATPSITTTYTLVGQNSPNCFTDSVFTLRVLKLPSVTITGQDSLCNGTSIHLLASGANSYTWSPPFGIDSSNAISVVANPTLTKVYKLIGRDTNSCVNSIQYTLNVIEPPQIQLSGNFSVCAGKSVSISATGADQFNWVRDSHLSIVSPSQVAISASENTVYKVIGINSNICKDSITFEISIEDCDDDFVIPNVFTPNKDGINDEFFIIASKKVKEFKIYVYDRWGNVVYEADNIEKHWNGLNPLGKQVSDGVYGYVLKIKSFSNKEIRKSGNITVIN